MSNFSKKTKIQIILAFLGLCFAWSFSWMAMKFQAAANIEIFVSLSYRFLAAGILMLILSKLFGNSIGITRYEVKFLLLTSLFNACLNFYFGYKATTYIPSCIVATIFCLTIIFSEFLSFIFLKHKLHKRTIFSGILGIFGVCLFVLPILKENLNFDNVLIGVFFAILNAFFASSGMIVIKKCFTKSKIPLMTYSAYSFLIGGIYSVILAILWHEKFIFDLSIEYFGSLVYSIVISTCLAFSCLYYLIEKIGPAKTNFSSLICTVGAILVSSMWENYNSNILNIIGLMLIFFALINEFTKK